MSISSKNRATNAGNVMDRVTLKEFDVTPLVGLSTVVCDAAYEEVGADGEVNIVVPHLRTLLASAAVARCLMPVRLRGKELRAMRKIMRLTLAGLAERLDAKTAPETISRWESEAQPIGGYAEKVIRLLVCDDLNKEATGVSYDGSMIAKLRVLDPWLGNKEYQVPSIKFHLVKMKEVSGTVVDAWDNSKQAA